MNNHKTLKEEDILYIKLYKCIRFYASEVLHYVCKDFYYNHPSSKDGTEEWDSFCKKIKKKKAKGVLGCLFPIEFIFNYDGEKEESYLDISSCFDLFNLMNYKKLSNEDKSDENKWLVKLHEDIYGIKKIRNDLCHSPIDLFKLIDLEEKKKQIQDYLKKVCESMNNIVSVESSYKPIQKSTNYEKLGEEIDEKISLLWSYNLYEDAAEREKLLDSIGNDELTNMMQKCRSDCVDSYKKLKSPSTFVTENDSTFPVEDIFVPMSLNCGEKIMTYKDIFTEPLRDNKTIPPVILLSSDAGHGKTTLCQKYTSIWSDSSNTEVPALNKYDLVLLIEMKRTKEKGLIEYLKNILCKDSFLGLDDEKIYYFLNQMHILVIIDAFDERSAEANQLVNDMFDKLNNFRCLITTRPHKVDEVTDILHKKGRDYLHVSLHGFKIEEVNDYIDKIFAKLADGSGKKDFKYYLDNLSQDFQDLKKVPLMTYLLIYLWVINKKNEKSLNVRTFTNLYTQIFYHYKQYFATKAKQNMENKKSYEECESIFEDLVSILAKSSSTSELGVIDENTISCIQKKLKDKDLDTSYLDLFLSTMFLTVTKISKRGQKQEVQYEYLHKTQMEYLIAFHIVEGNLNEIQVFEDGNLHNNKEVLKFVVGLLCEDAKKSKMIDKLKHILDRSDKDYLLLWKILCETMKKERDLLKPNANVLSIMKGLMKSHAFSAMKLDSTNVVSALQLLRYVEFDIREIVIDIDISVDPYHIFNFPETLQYFKNYLKNKNKKIDVEIRFKKHEQAANEKSSDELLSKMNDWTNILKFSGHLEKEGIKILFNNKKLVDINIRITGVETLEILCQFIPNLKSLKKIKIIFDKPLPKNEIMNVPIFQHTAADISIQFHHVENEVLDDAVKMLNKLTKRKKLIHALEITSDLEYKTAKEFFKKIYSAIDRKVEVKSLHDLDKDDLLKLEKCLNLNFWVKWNGY